MQQTTRFLSLLLWIMLPVAVSGAGNGRLTVLESDASIQMIFEEEAETEETGETGKTEEHQKILASFCHSADDVATWSEATGLYTPGYYSSSPEKLRIKTFKQLKEQLGEGFTITEVIIGITGFSMKDEVLSNQKITAEEFHKQNYAEVLNINKDIIHMINDRDLVVETAKVFAKKERYQLSPLILRITTYADGHTIDEEGCRRHFCSGEEKFSPDGASWQFGNLLNDDIHSNPYSSARYSAEFSKYLYEKFVDSQDELPTGIKKMDILGYLSMQLAQKEGITEETKTYLAEKQAIIELSLQNIAGQLIMTDLEEKKPLIVIAGAEYPLDIERLNGKLLTQSSPRSQGFCQGEEFLRCLRIAGANIASRLKSKEALNSN